MSSHVLSDAPTWGSQNHQAVTRDSSEVSSEDKVLAKVVINKSPSMSASVARLCAIQTSLLGICLFVKSLV